MADARHVIVIMPPLAMPVGKLALIAAGIAAEVAGL